MANYLTYGPSYCTHDALKDCSQMADLAEVSCQLERCRPGLQSIGHSDSSLALFAPLWKPLFPEARLVAILQPWERSLERYLTFTREHRYPGQDLPDVHEAEKHWRELHRALTDLWLNWPGHLRLVLDEDELNVPNAGRMLWEFCVPCEPWDEERWKMLNAFRVQIIPEKIEIEWPKLERMRRELAAPPAEAGTPNHTDV